MFQNGISRNTKCAERDGLRREGHICNSCDMGARDFSDMCAQSPRAYLSGKLQAPV